MNPFFAYLIKSSLSLMLLYCLFRVSMRNDRSHAINRFLLLGILCVSAIIPFFNIQFFYEEIPLETIGAVREFISPVVLAETDIVWPLATEIIRPAVTESSMAINWWLVFYLTAIIALSLRLIYGVAQVAKIIKRAEKRRLQKIVLAIVKDLIQPFSFLNKVVLSEKDFNENQPIVVAHEHAHIKQLHAIDLMVCELFTLMQFFNPFMWLLRRDLKLIHEYQADEAVLNKGIDAQKYQLLVLEKAVGERRFAMANHFTQKPILKRLTMMTKTNRNRWGRVKLILFVPILIILLQAFARPELITTSADFIPVKYTENKREKWLSKWTADNIGKGFFEPSMKLDDSPKSDNNILEILMNRNDEFLIENEGYQKPDLKKLVKGYLYGMNPNGNKGPDYVETEIPEIGTMNVSKGIIRFKHDINSSEAMVNHTLRAIGEAYLEVRDKKAKVLFDESYFDLDEVNQLAVNKAVPVWFAYEYPLAPQASFKVPFNQQPLPNPKPFDITIKSRDEIYVGNHKFSSLESFLEALKEWDGKLEARSDGMLTLKEYYRANLYVVDYNMPDDVWNKLQLAFYRSKIRIEKLSKPMYSYGISTKKSKPYKSPYATSLKPKYRDVKVLYITLFNDEKVDLKEIKRVAKECRDVKTSALIELEDKVSGDDFTKVKEVLEELGYDNVKMKHTFHIIPAPFIIRMNSDGSFDFGSYRYNSLDDFNKTCIEKGKRFYQAYEEKNTKPTITFHTEDGLSEKQISNLKSVLNNAKIRNVELAPYFPIIRISMKNNGDLILGKRKYNSLSQLKEELTDPNDNPRKYIIDSGTQFASKAILSIEDGVTKEDIRTVKKILKNLGVSKIEEGEMREELEGSANIIQTEIDAVQPAPMVVEVQSPSAENKIPFIRFHEDWIIVNSKSCEIATLNNVLEDYLPNDGNPRKVELVVYSSISKERVAQIYAELKKVNDLEIIRNDFIPSPPAAKSDDLVLHLYSDKIKSPSGKIIRMDEVSEILEEWREITGDKFSASFQVHGGVSNERINQMKKEFGMDNESSVHSTKKQEQVPPIHIKLRKDGIFCWGEPSGTGVGNNKEFYNWKQQLGILQLKEKISKRKMDWADSGEKGDLTAYVLIEDGAFESYLGLVKIVLRQERIDNITYSSPGNLVPWVWVHKDWLKFNQAECELDEMYSKVLEAVKNMSDKCVEVQVADGTPNEKIQLIYSKLKQIPDMDIIVK